MVSHITISMCLSNGLLLGNIFIGFFLSIGFTVFFLSADVCYILVVLISLCIAGFLQTDTVSAETVEACLNNPSMQTVHFQCNNNMKIYIQHVSVGKSWELCDNFFCSYENLEQEHKYVQNLTNKCNGLSQCSILARELEDISRAEPYIFGKCGTPTPVYNDRNKVQVDFLCSGEFGHVFQNVTANGNLNSYANSDQFCHQTFCEYSKI